MRVLTAPRQRHHVLLAATVLVPCGSASEARTIHVDCTYTGPISDGSTTHPYKRINAGIGDVTAEEDKVLVRPGVYWENVVIDKSLTLSGTGPDTTVIKGKAGAAVTIRPNLRVTIEKLTVSIRQ